MRNILLITLFFTASLWASSWKELKPTLSYKTSNYKLTTIECLEFREYLVNENHTKIINKKPHITLSICPNKAALNLRKFHNTAPKLSSKRYMRQIGNYNDDSCQYEVNAFVLDSKGVVYRMDENKDPFSYLVPLDTPAKIALVLDLLDIKGGEKYRKKGKVLEVKTTQVESNPKDNYCVRKEYLYTLSLSGKLISKKLIKSKKLKEECIYPYIMPCDKY